jgi:hypothetical protein
MRNIYGKSLSVCDSTSCSPRSPSVMYGHGLGCDSAWMLVWDVINSWWLSWSACPGRFVQDNDSVAYWELYIKGSFSLVQSQLF